jgi:hypothetical protein
MAKAAVVSLPTALKFPELKFPKFDLDARFAAQKANLAAVQEAQSVLLRAAEAVAKVQYGYVEQSIAKAKAAFAAKELPRAETLKAAGEQAVAVAKEVVDLTVAAQRRVFEVLTQRTQASVEEIKAVAA